MKERKRFLEHLLDNCRLASLDERELHLCFADPYTLEMVQKEDNLEILKQAVQDTCGYGEIAVKLDLQTEAAGAQAPEPGQEKKNNRNYGKTGNAAEEEILKDALDIFGGMVIK